MTHYRIVQDQPVYFVTFSVVQWLPVFISEEPCRIIAESFGYCYEHKHLRTCAYVIMPTHMHSVVFDRDYQADRLRQTMADMRKFTGRKLAEYCRLQMPSYYASIMSAEAGKDRERRFWQPGLHPEAIYSERFLRQKVEYIHDNPRRKGLVREPHHWRYSSAAYWHHGGDSELELTSMDG